MFEAYVRRLFGRTVHVVAALAGAWALLYTAIILFYQGTEWLKTDYWKPEPIGKWLWESFRWSPLPTEWLGFNKILEALLNLHIGILMVVLAIGCFVIAGYGVMIHERAEQHIKELRETKKRARAA